MFLFYESIIMLVAIVGIYFFGHKKFRTKSYLFLITLFCFILLISCPLYIKTEVKAPIDTNVDDFHEQLKESGYWIVDHIEIDPNNPLLTWEVINQTYEWCTGNGTIDDPFIIENVSIKAINYDTGISISGSKGIYFIIKNSQISNSSIGIKLDTSDDGAIINNTISNNNETGILIHNCKRTNIIGNIIQNNSQYGVHLNGPNSKNNNIYKNEFIINGKHALDESKPNFNFWYNSSVGNYWDNYTGKDANDDNIGDIPYNYIYGSANSQDIYPTWWDPPSLSISYPLNYSSYAKFAANFKAIIDEGKGDTFWYEIASKNSSFLSLSGLIDEEIIDVFEQDLWDNLSNGTHRIRLYVNDSKGYIGIEDIVVKVIIPTLNNWWNSSYAYRVPLKLVNKYTKELPIGYSVNVSLNTANLISAGKLRNDGNDLRIVWYNVTNDVWLELDRINETNFNTIDTRIWFKTQSPVSSNTYDGCYYLYYGCNDCGDPPTNEIKIYDFFDDFNQPDGPANGWTVINGTWSVNNTEYVEYQFVEDGRSLLNTYMIENASIEVRINSSGGNFGAGVMFRHLNNQNFYTAGIGFWEYEVAIGKWTDDVPYVLDNTSDLESVLIDSLWYDLKIEVLGSHYLVYLNGILKNNITDTDHLNASQIGLMTWTTSAVSSFDNLKIRLLVSNEPIISLGDEETFKPQFNYIIEGADPLELGNNVDIIVNVTDLVGIIQVLIEFAGVNFSMTHIGGDLWQNDTWIPPSIGNFTYKIYSQNINLQWNSIIESIQVIDITPPTFSALTESKDPLELGKNESITVNASDFSGINQVLIEFEGFNHSMINILGDKWQYDTWFPSSIGIYSYTIYIEDNNNNWNSTSGTITVEDKTFPTYWAVIESADPLELGETEIIKVNVSDTAGINQVLIEFESTNHSMINVIGDTWQYDTWTPLTVNTYIYTIYIEDNNNNWNSTSGSITVEDNTPPTYSDLSESADPLELGNNETITIKAFDISGINQVLIEFEGTNHSMTNIIGDTWQYDTWNPTSMGINLYIIYIQDNNNNWNLTSDSIIVEDTTSPVYWAITESADPLELGELEIIKVNVSDIAGINQVLIEFEGFNHSMINIIGDMWQYDTWTPLIVNTYIYTIYIEDNNNNWNSTSGSITVEDNTPPTYSDLSESIDPLELGDIEIITINASDISGINLALIEFEGTNHSMTNIIGDMWQYNSWVPSSTGIYIYTIYIGDNNNNWNSTSGSITVEDTTYPTYEFLIESDDPLELGETEIITINASDFSGINQVLIEFQGANHSMTNIIGYMWQYNAWTPLSTGTYPYRIYIEDNNNNWNSTSDSISVEDTTPPIYSDLSESADPIELGHVETITINAFDISGINQILIEFEGTNHSMVNTIGNTWQYDSWIPPDFGIYIYIIYIEDNNDNWNSTDGSITVADSSPPTYSDLSESADPLELGNNETITINAFDISGINQVLIEFEGANHSMTNIIGNTWQYDMWVPLSTGTYIYTIYIEDNHNNWNSTSGSIEVKDTITPTYSNLNESADPLELGDTETITINVSDISGINQVLIEFEGFNHSMINVIGDTWQYDAWVPLSTGTYIYTIYIEDNNNNWNSTSGSITVEDNKSPTYWNLNESGDPLELGDTETITINVSDISGINQVLIEFESANHSMTNIIGYMWQYNAWTPLSTGTYNYKIYIEDNNNNWNSTSDSISVEDTSPPTYSDLTESADPIELGHVENITINAFDISGINQVLIEFEGANHSMVNTIGNTWQYDSWIPPDFGIYIYIIYIEDNNDNWNSTDGSITVADTTPPTYSDLSESADPLELGDTETITINVFDISGINQVLIEFEGANHSMTNIIGNTWQYDMWVPLSTGTYIYTIYIEDNHNNWNSTSGSIEVKDTITPTYSNLNESADPLELGDTETININVSDISGINQVLIEFEGANHSMTNLIGNTWQFNFWIPSITGIYPYIIYIQDNNNNWNSTSGDITVEDTTSPTYSDLSESADPLELGDTETITINAFDISGINQVLIEFGGINHSMTNIVDDTWQYDGWTPLILITYTYTIFIEDKNNNWNSTSGSIMVEDTTPPTYSDLTESADPLELGDTETITINVSDIAGINQVLIEFEGANHSMTNLIGDMWQFNSWIPSNIGIYPYIIYVQDNNDNWNSTSGSIIVEDTTPPTYSDLTESADPLELGNTETITINVSDISGINQVLIEFEGANHSMTNIVGDTWQYNAWTPLITDLYLYTIYIEDNNNIWNSTTGSITVEDTTPPTYSDLTESADPLELGNTETISINVSDISGINQVLIEFEGANHSMTNLIGDTWQFNSWIPSITGIYPYTIYIQENNDNWNSTSGSIIVEDTTPPTYSDLTESADPLELGDTETITINISDIAGINQVLIEFEGANHSMTNIVGDTWQYNAWTPLIMDLYLYTIYIEDNNNIWNSTTGSITVVDTTPPTYSNLTESADPLELGNTETISINVSDISGIYQVLIEFEGANHSMTNLIGDTWQYNAWIPPDFGTYIYIIYIEDNNSNWNSTSGAITVADTTPPTYWGLTESKDPLELGETEVIIINVTDSSGINQVLIEFEGFNHSMTNIIGNTWQYDTWTPLSTNLYLYTIYIEDNNNNWNSTSGSITVEDTTLPTYSNLNESADPLELGNTETITINVSDISGINQVLIEFEGTNHSMTNIIGYTWQYNAWTPLSTGTYPYIIYIQDNNDNWNSTSGSITVEDTTLPTYSNLNESADPL
ncbi:MAG: right-handed parallel beta-helix repeat-containing protein, partial [Promethearchaeota archaeon]